MPPLADPIAEAERILAAAREQAVWLRLMGGVAIGLRCPCLRSTGRTYHDLDFVAPAEAGRQVQGLFPNLGYQADRTFNKLHGALRLLFWDETNQRRIDVLIDRLDMSHTLELRRRLHCDDRTLSLADLLLSKLQIVQISDRDILDTAALLHDHPLTDDDRTGINAAYVSGLCANDWGLYRTCQINLERLGSFDFSPLPPGRYDLRQQAQALLRQMAAAPKTLRWKLRARVGERLIWYRLPEEIGR